jgi:hypothetical protein
VRLGRGFWPPLLGATSVLLAGCSQSSAPPLAAGQPQPPSVHITQLYATAPRLARGEKELLCYGVEHAQTVWLSPPRQELTPSLTRCIEVSPERTTTYTLTAQGAKGETAPQNVTITVGPPKPPKVKLREVTVTSLNVKAGQPVGLCYQVENAVAVTISPIGYHGGAQPKGCTSDTPSRTTTYVVSATGPAGDRDQEKVTVTVQ